GPLICAVAVNKSEFSTGDTLIAMGGVTNLGTSAATAPDEMTSSAISQVADFYAGVLFPDGNTLAFFTNPNGGLENVIFGRLADLGSFQPIASGVSLATAFS